MAGWGPPDKIDPWFLKNDFDEGVTVQPDDLDEVFEGRKGVIIETAIRIAKAIPGCSVRQRVIGGMYFNVTTRPLVQVRDDKHGGVIVYPFPDKAFAINAANKEPGGPLTSWVASGDDAHLLQDRHLDLLLDVDAALDGMLIHGLSSNKPYPGERWPWKNQSILEMLHRRINDRMSARQKLIDARA